MSSKRPPAPPPHIPGFSYVSLLGSGGFSDVYLYEQDRPRRKVAVKVLLADLRSEGARRRFESEANLMAQLSTHPYIVTIYEAEVTDAGHSYLAMEYCSRPSLDVRYRKARFSVDEVLAIGIQVASAVETAHRAGIAHRDIKPANILVTDYNRPALTDFGISGTMDAGAEEDAGMSIPWSPPESFAGTSTDGVKVDVWALGATLYTLLAGRSPFVLPGADNSQRELISRISAMPLPQLGRADVPESLELVLATAMAKSPQARYSSAQAFARALMRVQTELNLSVTPFEVLDDSVIEEAHPDDNFEATRVRSITSIDPDAVTHTPTFPSRLAGYGMDTAALSGQATTSHAATAPAATAPAATAPAATAPAATAPAAAAPAQAPAPAPQWVQPPPRPESARTDSVPDHSVLASTLARPAPAAPLYQEPAKPASKAKVWLAVCAAAVVLIAAAVTIALVSTTGAPKPAATSSASTKPSALDLGTAVPQVTGLSARAGAGGANWTWTNPDPQAGDTYQWAATTAVSTGDYHPTKEPKAFVANNAQGLSCISVMLVRKDGRASTEQKACFPV